MPKYALPLVYIFPSTIVLIWENKDMILFLYRKIQIGVSQHFGKFYAVII